MEFIQFCLELLQLLALGMHAVVVLAVVGKVGTMRLATCPCAFLSESTHRGIASVAQACPSCPFTLESASP